MRLSARITDQRKGCSVQRSNWISLGSVCCWLYSPSSLLAADWQTEWERTLAAAKKEGTLVVGIPASSELRKAIGTRFKEKFGIDVELFPSRGPENVTRIIKEYTAGVRYFDVLRGRRSDAAFNGRRGGSGRLSALYDFAGGEGAKKLVGWAYLGG